ncbi:MAG: ATP-binding protein [Candidatus Tectomicrobia bacterium]|nr:ATP-binding protein [Candidatus Tectomicrobia bacterium]
MHETEHSQEQLRTELTVLRRRVQELETTQATLAQQNISLQDARQQVNADLERETTTRKLLEGKLQQAQKMEAIGILAGGIAHDFNNILGVMIGYTELMASELGAINPLQAYLQEIFTAGKRAKALVQQILTFSRRNEQKRQPLCLHQLANETLKLLRASLPSTITFATHISPQSGAILADPTQMHQVLMNLCTNAEYAMRQAGGTLEVGLEAVDVGDRLVAQNASLKPGPHVCLTVRDTGHGMTPDVCARIFDPFFTTKKEGDGTGMGLAVVHGIVTSHGGAITVMSTPNQGSLFTVYLPQLVETAVGDTLPEEPLPYGQGMILFVDDEVALAQAAHSMLTRMGYTVTTCTNSEQALATFQASPDQFDLVITDQTMPELTGENLARALRQIRPNLPIILCTGFSHVMTPEKAQGLKLDAFLMKPLTMQGLGQAVQCVLARRLETAEAGARQGMLITPTG